MYIQGFQEKRRHSLKVDYFKLFYFLLSLMNNYFQRMKAGVFLLKTTEKMSNKIIIKTQRKILSVPYFRYRVFRKNCVYFQYLVFPPPGNTIHTWYMYIVHVHTRYMSMALQLHYNSIALQAELHRIASGIALHCKE